MLNTKGQYMKESNTLAGNATIKLLRGEILLDTKGQYMKELNTLVDSGEKNLLENQQKTVYEWIQHTINSNKVL